MTDILADVKAALAEATHGPWRAEGATVVCGDIVVTDIEPRRAVYRTTADENLEYAQRKRDAHLIANAPDWLRALVAEVERLRARDEQYTELIMAVVKKWPDESRHQTALRYIQEAETPKGAAGEGAWQTREASHEG